MIDPGFVADVMSGDNEEAKALLHKLRLATHTHVGSRSHVGHVHSGARLWGHRSPKAGRRHALNGGPVRFTALCGKTVALKTKNDFGEPAVPNVRAVSDPESRAVTCKRCLRLMAGRS